MLRAIPCLAIPLGLAGDDLVHRPTVDGTLRRELVVQEHLELDFMTMDIDSDELQPPEGLEDMQQEHTIRTELVVLEDVEALDEDGILRMRRAYEKVRRTGETTIRHAGQPEQRIPANMDSAIEGNAVLFVRSEAGLAPSLPEDSSLEEDDLAGLRVDLTLTALLPARSVTEGDRWDVSPSIVEELLQPGGDLRLRMPGGDAIRATRPRATWEGEVTVRYREKRSVEGRALAVLELEVDVEAEVDMTDGARTVSHGDDGVVHPEPTSIVRTTTHSGRGECLWDLDAGRVARLDLELETTRLHESEMILLQPGVGEIEMVQSQQSSGETTVSVRFVLE